MIRLRGWFERRWFVLPLAILIAGGIFRFFHLNWDDGHQLHPDERWIYMVVSGANGNPAISWPGSIGQFLDIHARTGSPLDPHFFAYGSLPFYLLAFVAGTLSFLGQHLPFLSSWSSLDTYGGLLLLGRGLSATLDLLSLVLLFTLGRRVYGYWTGILAMALGGFTVLNIQLAHFYAVDTVLLPLVLLTLLAAVGICSGTSRAPYVWGGIAFGAALATKTTALLLLIPLAGAALLAAWEADRWPAHGTLLDRARRWYSSIAPRLNANLVWLLLSFAVAALTFVILEPYAVLDRAQLLKDFDQQTTYLVTNSPPFEVPYTTQYANTIPYLYQLKNLLFWDLGIPLALTAFAGVLFALVRNGSQRLFKGEVVLLLWVLPYFLFVGRFFAKFSRYMLPITPIITLMGAAFVIWLLQRRRIRWRLLGGVGLASALTLSFLYSVAYTHIYAQPNTRVAASGWIYKHIPPGTTVAVEGPWDETLPLDVGNHTAALYHSIQIDPYAAELSSADRQQKLANISDVLMHAKYILISSERMVASVPRVPDRYPMAIRYYDLLTSNRLNFRLARQFQNHPQLGPIVVHDYPADESFHVYDHPNVRIFKRVAPITAKQVRFLLTAPASSLPRGPYRPSQTSAALSARPAPDTRLMLSGKQWAEDQRGQTLDQMFPPGGFGMRYPVLVWLLALELLGLLAFPFTFLFLNNLSDRGFVISKTLGLLVLGYAVWIIVSLGGAIYDRSLILLVLLGFAIASAGLAFRLRGDIAAFIRQRWRVVLTGELIFLAGFALFIVLRMWYPDLGHQFAPVSLSNSGSGRMGEKQMELAFLNAIVRSRVFPPYDPFFAQGYINYYYYGFFLVGTMCKLTAIVPAVSFNLAIATFFAMLLGNVFSVVLNITRRVLPGIVAAVFVGLIGNLNGCWQLLRDLMSVGTIHSSIPLLGGAVDVLSGLVQVTVHRKVLPAFDFWEPTRIVPPIGSVITEFPFFTYLFSDLHPHLIAYPLAVAALALAVNFLLGSRRGLLASVLTLLIGGMLLGALAVTNPWDFPTYLIIIGIGSFVGAYALRRRIHWTTVLSPAAWMFAIALVAFILYLPFERSYRTVFATGLALVRDVSPQLLQANGVASSQVHDSLVTPLRIYLEHFGFQLFVVISYLILLLGQTGVLRWLRRQLTVLRFVIHYRERFRRMRRAMRIARRVVRAEKGFPLDISVLLGVAILAAGLLFFQYFLLAFLVLMLGIALLLLLRLGQQLSASQLFLLALLFVPVLLSVATQVVFIKDWLASGSSYRMNTIFKFYNQIWVLYAIVGAAGLYYFFTEQISGTVEEMEEKRAESASREGPLRADPKPAYRLDADIRPSGSAMRRLFFWQRRLAATSPAASLQQPFDAGITSAAPGPITSEEVLARQSEKKSRPAEVGRLRRLIEKRPLWSLCFAVLAAVSLIYTYSGTVSRETYRSSWLPESSVPLTLNGMAFMKRAYPSDYAGISWLNAHVHGAQVIAEADDAYYDWRSRVSMFTGLPNIINGIHEAEQRYSDEIDPSGLCGSTINPGLCLQQTNSRADDLKTLYDSARPASAWRIIRLYHVRLVYVGFSERQAYRPSGLAKFRHMVGHGLEVVYRHPGVTIYRVTRA